MAKQRSLFPDAPAPRAAQRQSLVVRASRDRPLSKLQQTFNRLVAKIERLRVQIERERERLEAALVFQAEYVRPRLERLVALRKNMVRAFRPFLHDRRVKKGEMRTLRDLLVEQLNEILAHDATEDADLRELFEELHGMTVAELEQEQMQEMRSAMEAMCADMGLDIDLSDLRPGMTDAEIAAKSAEMADEMRRQAEAAFADPPRRRDTKRARREEERARQAEEARRISIGSIYRQLAKVLHPDLEPDADRRQRKVILMQELTTAYANNDLHTLLRLELEWIRREKTDAVRLSDEKLAAVNQVLREQVAQLELELEQLPYHPRFQPLVHESPFEDPFAGGWGRRVGSDGPAQTRQLDMLADSLTASLARLQSSPPLPVLREILRAYRAADRRTIRVVF